MIKAYVFMEIKALRKRTGRGLGFATNEKGRLAPAFPSNRGDWI